MICLKTDMEAITVSGPRLLQCERQCGIYIIVKEERVRTHEKKIRKRNNIL
jgi:hypothetical protein